jgi:broad specificity phosphatase PhoE
MSKIYLIRHAQASFLADDYDNLSDKGRLQSETLGQYFVANDIHFDKVFIGKLKRHQQTFDSFSQAYTTQEIKLPKPSYLETLNEHHALDALHFYYDDFITHNYSAKKLAENIHKNPELKQKNTIQIFALFLKAYASGKFAENHKTIQSWSSFRMQTKKGMATILEKIGNGETIGVFTSGGTKSAIIGDCLELSEDKISELNLVIRNTSFSQLLFSNNKLNVLSLNETPHLKKELITFV